MAQLGGSVVRDSLDDTLAAHKGLNRIRMMYSPRLDARDEETNRVAARVRGIDLLPATSPVKHFFKPLDDGGKKYTGGPKQRVPFHQGDKSRMAAKGMTNRGPHSMPPSIAIRSLPDPNQPRVHDSTSPEIDWRRADAHGNLPAQRPWLDYMEHEATPESKHRLNEELIAYCNFMDMSPAEEQVHRHVEQLITLKLLQHLDASVGGQTGLVHTLEGKDASLPRLKLPHSDVVITLRPTDPAKQNLSSPDRGPSPTRPLMQKISLNLLKKTEQFLKSTDHFSDANGNHVFENVRLTGGKDPYVAARHVPTGLRVVITTSPKLMRRLEWVDKMWADNVPSLAILYTAFRNFLDFRNLFDPGDTTAIQAATCHRERQPPKLKLARGLDHYTLSALLVAAFKLTTRISRRPIDIADHFLDVLNFLANVDMAKYRISIDPPLLIPVGSDALRALKSYEAEPDQDNCAKDPMSENCQYVEARYRILDPIDPRWDLGASLSLSRVIKRAFKGWQNDITRRMEQWDQQSGKIDVENSLLEALGTNYEPFELWRDNLLIQGTKLGSELKSLRQSTKQKTE
ncbi:hypothetical protein KEM56_001135 [Ascosphaera pollenicola]|nr:hypothetical protein KEM56_001135 [Ascosphaera pollenicola]